jgi:hypothetical protein
MRVRRPIRLDGGALQGYEILCAVLIFATAVAIVAPMTSLGDARAVFALMLAVGALLVVQRVWEALKSRLAVSQSRGMLTLLLMLMWLPSLGSWVPFIFFGWSGAKELLAVGFLNVVCAVATMEVIGFKRSGK